MEGELNGGWEVVMCEMYGVGRVGCDIFEMLSRARTGLKRFEMFDRKGVTA